VTAGRARALIAVLAACVGCDAASADARRGVRLYEGGKYVESYAAFERAFEASRTPALGYNAGNALYQMHRYDAAARRFRQAAEGPRPLRQRSYYNLGNTYVRAAEGARDRRALLARGIAAYEEALRLDPADSAAKWNLELALRRLADADAAAGSGGRGRRGDFGAYDQQNDGYEGDPQSAVGAMAGGGFGSAEGETAEELSEAEARQLLEAVEREQLSTHRARPAKRPTAGQLDW
jgi:tetratricopeptide (TPR) repeat protein